MSIEQGYLSLFFCGFLRSCLPSWNIPHAGSQQTQGTSDATHSSAGSIVLVLLFLALAGPRPRAFDAVLADRDLDALQREALAQRRALDHAGELLGREDLERLREDGREDGRGAVVEDRLSVLRGCSDVDKVHLEAGRR